MRNIALVLFLSVAIAACSSQNHDGSSRMASPLDKILVMGHGTQEQWQKFIKDGGLQANDQWKGYTVQHVSLGFDPHDRLSEISLILTSGVDNRAPSFNNISRDLAKICGTDWHKGTPSTAENGNILCVFSPGKTTAYYQLEISKMEGMGEPGT